MVLSAKAPAHTLQQVRDLLDKVAAHPRLGNKIVAEILSTRGTSIPRGEVKVDDLEPKFFDRVFKRCEEVLKKQPSEQDEELIGKINDAVTAEEKATSILTDRGVELGKLLLEAFTRYPTERPFRAFLKWTAFTTLKRAADLIAAAGGRKESEELRRQLKRGADNTAKSKARNKPAITNPEVIADLRRIAANDDADFSADVRKAEAGNVEARKRLLDAGYTESVDAENKSTFTPPGIPKEPPPKPDASQDTSAKAKASKRTLAAGKSWLDDNLSDMMPEDRAALFHYFKFHAQMQGVKRSAA
jgi:hypothetical protein